MMRRARLDNLQEPTPLPAGYAVRVLNKARSEDKNAVAALLARAFDDVAWTPERVHTALVADPNVPTTYLIENANGELAATASVQFAPAELPHVGFLHWVGAAPNEAGNGLGGIVSLHVLRELRDKWGRTEARLSTDDFRLPAVRTYLKLGFRPLLTDETHPARWDAIAAQMPDRYAPWLGERA